MKRQMYEYRSTGEIFELRKVTDGFMAFSLQFGIRFLKLNDLQLFRPVGER